MFETVKKALKELVRGPITVEYPKESSSPPSNFRGKHSYQKEKCIGCGLCVTSCPSGALKLSKNVVKINPGRCIYCQLCEEVCPKEAIKLSNKPIQVMA